jgi:hypothetical protein
MGNLANGKVKGGVENAIVGIGLVAEKAGKPLPSWLTNS